MITRRQEAQAVAEACGASVIVWGNYTPDFVELNVQTGVTDAFHMIGWIPREDLERTANVQVRMKDEHSESVAFQVLGVLGVLFIADGDLNELLRNVAIMSEIEVSAADIISGGVAEYAHRFSQKYLEDTPGAISELDKAVDLAPGNPLLYALRGCAYIREGSYASARQNLETAQLLGPDTWAAPVILLLWTASQSGDMSETLSLANQVAHLELRPDDWFTYYNLGLAYYLRAEYELAQEQFKRAIELGPNANYPYVFATILALCQGQRLDASDFAATALSEFPDKTLGHRVLMASAGDKGFYPFADVFRAYGNLILAQYLAVIQSTEHALAINSSVPDIYLMQGLAYCGLQEYEDAQNAYSRAIELDDGFPLLYLLRAEVRNKLGDQAGAQEDLIKVYSSRQEELVTLVESGEGSCESLFERP